MEKLVQWPVCPHRTLECGTPSDGAVGSPELPEIQVISLLELGGGDTPRSHSWSVTELSMQPTLSKPCFLLH